MLTAEALRLAIETAKIEFAPKTSLLSVPSALHKSESMVFWSRGSWPITKSLISLFIKLTAFITPLPWNLDLSWSLNSKASWLPVDAPEGTYASEELLSESFTSAATVGFPRESNTLQKL